MQIKEIKFLHEVEDVNNDNLDVGVTFDNGSSYTILVCTPNDFLQEMEEEKTNFVEPGVPVIVVKQLTEEIVTEAIQAYFKWDADGYWLKLCQFGDHIDISVLNKLDSQKRELDNLIYGEGFYYSFRSYLYFNVYPGDRVLFGPMVFLTLVTLVSYCILKPGLLDFIRVLFQNITI